MKLVRFFSARGCCFWFVFMGAVVEAGPLDCAGVSVVVAVRG